MKVTGKVCVVTGGASGLGTALCRRFVAEGAAGVVVVDRNAEGAKTVADEVGGYAIACDLAVEDEVTAMVAAATDRYGRVDVLCNNAGIANDDTDFVNGPIDVWHSQWAVNVMGQVYACRAVIPQMLERGEGYLQHTASMAGILTSPGAPAYAATKHAVVGLAEWLSVTYGHSGIKVFLLCPLGIDTPMLDSTPPALRAASGGVRTADEVAQQVIDGFDREELLILTDPNADAWIGRKNADLERWLESMRRLQDQF